MCVLEDINNLGIFRKQDNLYFRTENLHGKVLARGLEVRER